MNKNKPDKKGKSAGSQKDTGVGIKGQQPGGDALRAQALANARAAREAIGEETLQRIAAAIKKKEGSAIEQAKAKIASSDVDRVVDEIFLMFKDRENR